MFLDRFPAVAPAYHRLMADIPSGYNRQECNFKTHAAGYDQLGDASRYDLSASLFLIEYSISSAVVLISNISIALYL